MFASSMFNGFLTISLYVERHFSRKPATLYKLNLFQKLDTTLDASCLSTLWNLIKIYWQIWAIKTVTSTFRSLYNVACCKIATRIDLENMLRVVKINVCKSNFTNPRLMNKFMSYQNTFLGLVSLSDVVIALMTQWKSKLGVVISA